MFLFSNQKEKACCVYQPVNRYFVCHSLIDIIFFRVFTSNLVFLLQTKEKKENAQIERKYMFDH